MEIASVHEFVAVAIQNGIEPAELVEMVAKETIVVVMERNRNNKCRAAKTYGVHRNTMARWLRQMNYKKPARSVQPEIERSA